MITSSTAAWAKLVTKACLQMVLRQRRLQFGQAARKQGSVVGTLATSACADAG
jgi:hypothetical protein